MLATGSRLSSPGPGAVVLLLESLVQLGNVSLTWVGCASASCPGVAERKLDRRVSHELRLLRRSRCGAHASKQHRDRRQRDPACESLHWGLLSWMTPLPPGIVTARAKPRRPTAHGVVGPVGMHLHTRSRYLDAMRRLSRGQTVPPPAAGRRRECCRADPRRRDEYES